MRRFGIKVWAAAVVALSVSAGGARAQTQDDFFNDNVLHEIRLIMNPTDWQTLKLKFDENTYYPAEFHWSFQGHDIVVEDIGVRSRGTGSRSSIKPSFRMDFNRYAPDQEFLGLKSVLLRGNTQDASMMKERLSMLFFRKIGLPALREAHTRVFVNNEYAGLYTIVESVDKKFLKRNFGEDEGYLYKYRFDAGDPAYYFEYKGPDPSLYVPKPFLPETHETDPKPQPIVDMIRTLNQSSDGNFQSAMAPYFDLKLAMGHVALENFVAEQDGFLGDYGTNNFYMYRFQGKNLSRFLFWDKSNTFWGLDWPIFRKTDQNVITKRALEVPELRNAYLDWLARAAMTAGGEGGWLAQEVEREYSQIRAAALEDPNKQKQSPITGNLIASSNQDFEDGVNALRQFARFRSADVLNQVAAAGFKVAIPQLAPGGAVNAATFAGTVLAPGSLISVFGAGLSLGTLSASSLPLPTELSGVSIRINNIPAPLLFISSEQVNLQVPWEIASGTVSITATVNGVPGNSIQANVGPYSPGIFVVVHADGRPVSTDNPATAGEVLVAYATGLGPVTVNVPSGQASPASPPANTSELPTITIGGVPAEVVFSGLAPGFVGLYQVNVRTPLSVAAGSRISLALKIGGQEAPPAFIAIR